MPDASQPSLRAPCARRRRGFSVLSGVIALSVLASADARAEKVSWETNAEVGGYADSDNVSVLTPAVQASAGDVTRGWAVDGSYLVDIVSAASVDVISAASPRWNEVRHAATLGASYKPGDAGIAVSGATSVEPDYYSLGAGVTGLYDLAQRNVNLSLGYSYEHDVAGRVGTSYSVFALRLDRHKLTGGVEIVMDRATTLTPAVDVTLESGRQEKPYRFVPIFDPSVVGRVPVGASIAVVNQLRAPGQVVERLPDTRQRYAASVRLAHRFDRSTLVLWDRAYWDSWGLVAGTADLSWVFELSGRWSVWPHARFHAQSGASFWERAYAGSSGGGQVVVSEFRTGDRELSPLWTATVGPGVRFDMGGVDPRSLSATLELDVSYTDFRNTLYIDSRWSGLAVAGFSARFD